MRGWLLPSAQGACGASRYHPAATRLGRAATSAARRLPEELARIDAYLDDERFITPWRALFAVRLGRPSVPVPTLLRLLYLKHRYQLGYQTLCREVADSISWRRFARIPLDQPVPHPTTLSKLVGRAGPEVLDQLNAALLAKLAAGKLLRCRKLRVDTTVIAADIDHPPTPTCWSTRCAPSAGWSAASASAAPRSARGSGTARARPGAA